MRRIEFARWVGITSVAHLLTATVFAEVVAVDEQGFVSEHRVDIAATPARVFEALAEETGAWWDPAHTYWGDSRRVQLALCPISLALCEVTADDEAFVIHLRVDAYRPGKALVLSGGLGPLQPLGVAASMSFHLEAAEHGTRLDYRYVVNGRDVEQWAEPVDRVQGGQLARLKRYVETGDAVPSME